MTRCAGRLTPWASVEVEQSRLIAPMNEKEQQVRQKL
jgi:hypothetical protein